MVVTVQMHFGLASLNILFPATSMWLLRTYFNSPIWKKPWDKFGQSQVVCFMMIPSMVN